MTTWDVVSSEKSLAPLDSEEEEVVTEEDIDDSDNLIVEGRKAQVLDKVA